MVADQVRVAIQQFSKYILASHHVAGDKDNLWVHVANPVGNFLNALAPTNFENIGPFKSNV